ncbi:hypothetical protein STEG23_017387 [Scotinomys teguina]
MKRRCRVTGMNVMCGGTLEWNITSFAAGDAGSMNLKSKESKRVTCLPLLAFPAYSENITAEDDSVLGKPSWYVAMQEDTLPKSPLKQSINHETVIQV